MLSSSDKVRDYEVIAPLGSGGMAMLYLARRRGVGGFSRLVTLKLVHKHLNDDQDIIKLFLDEARISAHIAHPNVVHVEEVGQWDDSYFIAMEYVHGVSLAELLARLRERRLRPHPKLCVWVAAQIAEALHAAHEATGENGLPLNIVHHDVSPQNVLISHTGHVKLIDFGIANCQAESDASSSRRAVLGKLRYMSPEQLRVEPADRRTDVYALGVMLWEMLTGRGLLRCQRFDDTRDWATRENPPPPSKYSAHPTPALDRVVLKAIACKPSERFDSAFQFRTALLRADPEAVELDAPMVAALMRSVLGDELDRRRADWPSEIAGELEVAHDLTTSHKWSVDELTANYLSALSQDAEDSGSHEPQPPAEAADDGEDDPTLAAVRNPSHCLAALFEGVNAFAAHRGDLPLVPAFPGMSVEALEVPNNETDVAAAVAAPRALALKHVQEFKLALHRLPLLAAKAAQVSWPVAHAWAARVWPKTRALAAHAWPSLRAGAQRAWQTRVWAVHALALLSSRGLRVGAIGSVCMIVGVFLGTRLTPAPLPALPAPAALPIPAPMPEPTPEPAAPQPSAAAVEDHVGALTMRAESELDADARNDAGEGATVNEIGARERPLEAEAARSASTARGESRWYGARRSKSGPKQAGKPKPGSSNKKSPVRIARPQG